MKVTGDKESKEETKKMTQHPSFYNHVRTTNKANSVGKIHKFNISILLNPQASIHLLVSKTSWRCLEDMSWKTNWRCLHCNYLSLTKAFSRRSQDVLEMSSRHLAIWKFFTLRTSLKPLQDMSWRREIGRFNNFSDKTHFAVLSRYNASNEESHLVATPFSKI